MTNQSAIVIGAGIVGLAVARALALKGFSVTVIERSHIATGASIRNFGMIWPIGQPSGKLYDRAMRSRSIWMEMSSKKVFWSEPAGSLHLAYLPEELQVLEEVKSHYQYKRDLSLLNASDVLSKSPAVEKNGLLGGLFSPYECIVDPREAIRNLPAYLTEKYNVKFIWGTTVNAIKNNVASAGSKSYPADLIFVCTGKDFETLYPDTFSSLNITRCKLQMMRIASQPGNWRIGPALCGGLSLVHYKSFEAAESLGALKKLYQQTMPDYLKWGIHVMVSQNGEGELTIGDSHEYGKTLDPFDQSFINDLILDYLKKFAHFKDWTIKESWNGTYAKMQDGSTELFLNPEEGVYLLNGLGGAGMTLSFGLAEEVVASI
ncbi:MAG: TIGR03364 family FAD-dependent oxidoreductase [Flavitalea sp.]